MNKDYMNTAAASSPVWLEEKGKINEPLFCKEFISAYPIIFCGNRFYNVDGEISEDVISHSISEKVMPHVTNNVAAVVKRIIEALKLYCFSEPVVPKEDEIHLLNGILKTDGTWIPEKKFCVNRLNITYDPDIWNGEYYPVNFMLFLNLGYTLEIKASRDVWSDYFILSQTDEGQPVYDMPPELLQLFSEGYVIALKKAGKTMCYMSISEYLQFENYLR